MLCGLCRKHARRPQKSVVGKTTWVDIPCVTMTQHSLRRHDTSLSHIEAKKLELQLCLSFIRKLPRAMASSFSSSSSASLPLEAAIMQLSSAFRAAG